MSSSRFDILRTPITDLHVLQRKPIVDQRGYLERIFCIDELAPVIGTRAIVQANHTLNRGLGVVRGMHFQSPPHAECKIVSCLRGEIFDVAVDLRRNSPTFLRWYGEILSSDNHRSLVIPEGFAHGFQSLTDESELLYFSTCSYYPEAEGAINARDPRVNIDWPMAIGTMSEKDRNHGFLSSDFDGLRVGLQSTGTSL